MRTVLLVFVVSLFSLQAFAQPTIYGLINKEARFVTQDSSFNRKKVSPFTDVDGFESRLGAKGAIESDKVDFNYKFELGINSSMDNDAATNEQIRIRLAYVTMKGSAGTVTFGKAWTADALWLLAMDPLTATGAQLLGLEGADVAGNRAGGVGYKARYFQDMIGYQTPALRGFQLSVSVDRNNTNDLTTDSPFYFTNLLTYTHQLTEQTKMLIHGAYVASHQKNKFFHAGLQFHVGQFKICGLFGKEYNVNNVGAPGDVDYTNFAGMASYRHKAWLFGANFGYTKFADDSNQWQFALGPRYDIVKDVEARLLYKIHKIKNTTVPENTAHSIIVGLTVKI